MNVLSSLPYPRPRSHTPLTCHPVAHSNIEGGKGAVEEPGFQQRVSNRLKPVHVDPADTSLGAKWRRVRNAALSGVSTDVHDVSRRTGRGGLAHEWGGMCVAGGLCRWAAVWMNGTYLGLVVC